MPMNYVVSVPVNENLASFIGKKGSEEGLAFYNRKLDNDVIVAIMPASKEDKAYYSMAESMLIAGQIVISTESVDRQMGEAVVAASLAGKHVIITDDNDVSKIVGGVLSDFEVCGKEELLARIVSRREEHGGEVRVDVDKAFSIKGIGTVILGIVTGGKVRVHDSLYHTSGKQVNVRSIQSQDVDVQEAGYGTRVGLAVKGMEHDEIDKGDLLLAKPSKKAKSASAEIRVAPYANEKLEQQKRYTFVSNFSRTTCVIDEISGDKAMMTFEKPLSVLQGDRFMLVRDRSPRIFASGTVLSVS